MALHDLPPCDVMNGSWICAAVTADDTDAKGVTFARADMVARKDADGHTTIMFSESLYDLFKEGL